MTLAEQIVTIATIVVATMLTRFVPFLLFPAGKPIPKYIQYLGKVLPAAVFGLLVIYCLKNVSLFAGSHGIPEFISIALVVVLHRWKNKCFYLLPGEQSAICCLCRWFFNLEVE